VNTFAPCFTFARLNTNVTGVRVKVPAAQSGLQSLAYNVALPLARLVVQLE
jgi:hypothetical protein